MKKTITLAFLLLAYLFGFSQKVNIEELLLIKPMYSNQFNESNNETNTLKLKMDFNSPIIINSSDAKILKDISIIRVELYYTAFQISETFSQPKLNRERLEQLRKYCPGLFKQTFITWQFMAQNTCKTEQEAKTYFHGFVITYRPKPTATDAIKEVSSIQSFSKSDSLGHDTIYTVYQKKVKRKKIKTGYYFPIAKYKKEKGIVYKTSTLLNRRPQYELKIDTIITSKEIRKFIPKKNAISFVKRNLIDTTIFAALRRNKQWKDIAFVCDVTGSMSAYITQLLVWYKLNFMEQKIKHFTFFNDGDNKSDSKKRIGSTGGIYQLDANNYDAVELMIQQSMLAGCGGDAPENNCEALIETIKKYPNAKEYVMIADNFANVKDIELAKQINKPIHIIICGTSNQIINTDYLDLAKATNGSIHSMEQDLENLMQLHDGETIVFGGKKYILQHGKFRSLVSL